MKKRYKIGDRVILTEGSAYSHQSKGNPGTIIDFLANYRELDDDKLDYREFYFQIEWDNGNQKCYTLSDIEPFKKVDDEFRLPDYWSEEVNPEEPEEKNSLIQKVNQINYPVKRKTKRRLTI